MSTNLNPSRRVAALPRLGGMGASAGVHPGDHAMNRRVFLGSTGALTAFSALAALPALAASPATLVQVYKSPTCGCCGAWVEHMRGAGFTVAVTEVDDPSAVRARLSMPDRYGSCHTATVGGYVLEGHVPAVEVRRLLASKPAAVGLAVPGMVPGSPGMEMGTRHDPYQVLLIDRAGRASAYATYPKQPRSS